MNSIQISMIPYLYTPGVLNHLLIMNIFLWMLYYIYPIMDKIMSWVTMKIKNQFILEKKYILAKFMAAFVQIVTVIIIYYWTTQLTFIEKLSFQASTSIALLFIFLQLSRFVPMFINGIMLGKNIEPFIVWRYIIKIFIISYSSTLNLPVLLSHWNSFSWVLILESLDVLFGIDEQIENNGIFPKYRFIKYLCVILEISNTVNDFNILYELKKIMSIDALLPILISNGLLFMLLLFFNVWHMLEPMVISLSESYKTNELDMFQMQNEDEDGNGYNTEKVSSMIHNGYSKKSFI